MVRPKLEKLESTALRALIVGWVVVGGVVVACGVSCCGDEEDSGVAPSVDRILQGGGVPPAAPRVVGGDDVEALVALEGDEVVERRNGIGGVPTAGAEELRGHDGDVPVHAGNAEAVAA